MVTLCWVGLLGVLLPLYVAFRTTPSNKEKPLYLTDLKLSIPTCLLALAILGAVFLRFYKLETFPCWPNLDEGWIGTLAINLSWGWNWKFFYTFGETPPLSIWCPALLFKLGCSPAFSLWFPPAMVSLLTVFGAYFASRQFFSKTFSLVSAGLMAFSFWPLYIGRICHQGIWLPGWVCLVLFLWGRFQKAKGELSRRNWIIGLGLGLGFGSFTFTSWMAVAGVFILTFGYGMVGRAKKDWKDFSFFCGAFLVSLIPFFSAVVREGYGHHISSLSPWGGWFKEFAFFTSFFKYLAVLFWGAYEKDPAYTPVWGGFLNPLLGSFFFIGIIEMFHQYKQKLVQWVSVAFLLFLLPGALSPNLETFRVAQVLPLLLFVTALGIYVLLAKIPEPKQTFTLVLLLSFIAVFDFNLLAEPYRNPDAHPENFGRPLKSLEKYRAGKTLDLFQQEHGPAYVFSSFDPNAFNDPTLAVMNCKNYPPRKKNGYKAIEDFYPGPKEGDWIAIFVNIHLLPFLTKKFPDAQWFRLNENLPNEYGGSILGLIQANKNMPMADSWYLANKAFEGADLNRFLTNGGKIEDSLKILEKGYQNWTTGGWPTVLLENGHPIKSFPLPTKVKDPFIESIYWDKRATYEYEALNYDEQLRSYQMAVTRGYPTADLYYKMGQLYLVKQRYAEAKEAFLKATQAPLDLTPAKSMLEWLRTQPATNSSLK